MNRSNTSNTFKNTKPPCKPSTASYGGEATSVSTRNQTTKVQKFNPGDTAELKSSVLSSSQFDVGNTADQTSQVTGSRAQTAGRFRDNSVNKNSKNSNKLQTGNNNLMPRGSSHSRIKSGYSRINNPFTQSGANMPQRGDIIVNDLCEQGTGGEIKIYGQKDEGEQRLRSLFNREVSTTRQKQRPQTSKRPLNVKNKGSGNYGSLRYIGPSSTKNITSGEAGLGGTNLNMFSERLEEMLDRDPSRHLDNSYSPEREQVISVANRSVLSPNFVNGTEETEDSVIGVEKKNQ